MAYHFDVVIVKVEDKGPVVVRVVVRPQARGAIVAAAGTQRGGVEGVDLRARGDAECHVQRRVVGRAAATQKSGLGATPKPATALPPVTSAGNCSSSS